MRRSAAWLLPLVVAGAALALGAAVQVTREEFNALSTRLARLEATVVNLDLKVSNLQKDLEELGQGLAGATAEKPQVEDRKQEYQAISVRSLLEAQREGTLQQFAGTGIEAVGRVFRVVPSYIFPGARMIHVLPADWGAKDYELAAREGPGIPGLGLVARPQDIQSVLGDDANAWKDQLVRFRGVFKGQLTSRSKIIIIEDVELVP
jgi:hypothetical protein